MSINDATNVAAAAALSQTSTVKKSVAKTLTNNIFAKTIQHLTRKRYKCYYGKSFDQLPNDEVGELRSEILACLSGPDTGISDVSLVSHRRLLTARATGPATSQPSAPNVCATKTEPIPVRPDEEQKSLIAKVIITITVKVHAKKRTLILFVLKKNFLLL